MGLVLAHGAINTRGTSASPQRVAETRIIYREAGRNDGRVWLKPKDGRASRLERWSEVYLRTMCGKAHSTELGNLKFVNETLIDTSRLRT